ncbi:MAG: hypothetical protein RL885_19300 [Planctomycetota bacterium]
MPLGVLEYRLRRANKVVGYQKSVQGQTFYSKDLLWWNGTRIDHDERDAYLEMKDKNDRPLFDGDIVSFREETRERRAQIRKTGDWLEAFDIDEEVSVSVEDLQQAPSLTFVGFSLD